MHSSSVSDSRNAAASLPSTECRRSSAMFWAVAKNDSKNSATRENGFELESNLCSASDLSCCADHQQIESKWTPRLSRSETTFARVRGKYFV